MVTQLIFFHGPKMRESNQILIMAPALWKRFEELNGKKRQVYISDLMYDRLR